MGIGEADGVHGRDDLPGDRGDQRHRQGDGGGPGRSGCHRPGRGPRPGPRRGGRRRAPRAGARRAGRAAGGGPLQPGRGAGAGRRGRRAPRPPRRPGQQRRGGQVPPRADPGGPGDHLRDQPPGPVPAHQPAAGAARAERPGPGGHRVVVSARAGAVDSLGRPPARPHVRPPADLQPVQGAEPPVHRRAGQAAGRDRRHRQQRRPGLRPQRPRPGGDRRVRAVPAAGPALPGQPGAGAATSVYLASSPEVVEVSGRYFKDCRPTEPSALAQDRAAAERLWRLSAQLCGLPEG
jgi:hypothetical protein